MFFSEWLREELLSQERVVYSLAIGTINVDNRDRGLE